jgi:hypothetical protein
MGLIDLIKKTRFGFGGITPNRTPSSLPGSKLHNTYSINGQPDVDINVNPSRLDLDGKTPKRYIDNPPK